MIRLLHGASPAGLAVLPAADGAFIRPIIRARRGDVIAHRARHGLAYAEDPSNRDPRFLRMRVRTEVLPLLEALSPGIVGHLTALADELRAPPLPPVLDASGQVIALRRSHARELRRALALGLRSRIRLPGGREIQVDPARGPKRTKGGAKTAKSG